VITAASTLTGGRVVILAKTGELRGWNVWRRPYILDEGRTSRKRCNQQMVAVETLGRPVN